MKRKRALVLDTSAFIAGFDPFTIEGKAYSTPLVKEELKSDATPRLRFQTAVENGKLEIIQPENRFIEIVTQQSKKTGDFKYLSQADIEVLALALQLKTA
ncbi:hypothetical protein J7K27_01830, partial [Candidatus Bathyarchaeota archaeon]|nr:hypothetical protein [Candidatus Bathyarchaeota archaeon]